MKEFTLEKNHSHAHFVDYHLPNRAVLESTKELTQEKNHFPAHFVAYHSLNQAVLDVM